MATDPVLVHTSILNILMDQINTILTEQLKLPARRDDARAGVVRPGKLQDDPTAKKINVLIHPGGIDWRDGIDVPFGADNSFEIGAPYGATAYKRRFIVELQFFYTGDSRDKARQKSMTVMSRVQHALFTQDFTDLGPDSFGETAYNCIVCDQYIDEGGGDGSFNWRGKIYVEYKTNIVHTVLD